MNTTDAIMKELEKAKNLFYIPRDTLTQFRTFIMAHEGRLIREKNVTEHLCSFFLPIHPPTRSVFLVHHIKGNDWMPPGGHIDGGESPVDTVRREFNEELSYRLTDEPIRLVHLTVKHIRSVKHPCKTHFDFWYTVAMPDLSPFSWDRHEFYDAMWSPFEKGIQKMKLPLYRRAITDGVLPSFS